MGKKNTERREIEAYMDGYQSGLNDGITESAEIARSEGYDLGYNFGYNQGYKSGFDDAFSLKVEPLKDNGDEYEDLTTLVNKRLTDGQKSVKVDLDDLSVHNDIIDDLN